MRFSLAILVLCAPLYAQTCDYTVQPPTLTIPSGGAIGQISVSTQTGCAWTATNPSLTWLHLSATQGTGSGTVSFTADANITQQVQAGTITVAGKTIAVTQAAASCTYAINPKSTTIGASGGSGSFAVTTGCVWGVSISGNFISVAGGNTLRAGNGTANYTVTPNGCVYGRNGSITVGSPGPAIPAVFAIAQDGSPTNMTLTPAAVNAAPAAADGRITVATGAGCTWTATSSESWLQILSGSGTGNGAITYHLLANNTAPRTGTIRISGGLSITVTQDSMPSINTVSSAANYRSEAISPGEIVVLFGARLGPAKPETLQVSGGFVTKSLGGTQVLFDGVPAPLTYASDLQVNAVVPYGVAGKASTQIQVINNGVPSNTKSMQVQTSHPGIFTLDSSGLGQGAILNQDYQVNGPGTPAARGSVVFIYATGGGTTLPALADGEVTGTDLPYLTQNVTVTIGGIDARVFYAGGVPAAVAGLTQINAEVPAGVATGNAVPVLIRVGPYTSSQGVTLAVQ